MQLRRLLVVLRRRTLLVAVIVVAGLAAAYLGTSRATVYQAQSSIYVGQSATNLNPTTEYAEAVLAQTFVLIVPTPTVINQAISAASIKRQESQVAKATRARAAPGTNLIKITVQDSDPAVAKSLADSIANAFVADARSLAPLTAASTGLSADKAPASVAQFATVPTIPLSTGLGRNVTLGGLAGIVVGIALVMLLDFFGLSARTPRQLEDQMDLPVIGVVPLHPGIAEATMRKDGDRSIPLLLGENA